MDEGEGVDGEGEDGGDEEREEGRWGWMHCLRVAFDRMEGVNYEVTTGRGGILYRVAVLQRILSRGRKFGSRTIQ